MAPRAGELQVTGENGEKRKEESKSGASVSAPAPSWSYQRLPSPLRGEGTRPDLPSTSVCKLGVQTKMAIGLVLILSFSKKPTE